MSRGERRRALERTKQKRRFIIGCIAAALVVIAVIVIIALNVGGKKHDSILSHVPNNVDAAFVSDTNAASWEYMETLAGVKPIPDIQAADSIGVAWINGQSYLYAAGEPSAMNEELATRGMSDVPQREGVYVIHGEKAGLSDGNLGDALVEKVNPDAVSIGYMTNRNIDSDFFSDASGMPTNDWTWTGTFEDGRWVGDVEGLKASDFDQNALAEWVGFEKKPAWVNTILAMHDDKAILSLAPERITEITGWDTLVTRIGDINIIVDNDGTMEVSLKGN